jgi:hypothetical protein
MITLPNHIINAINNGRYSHFNNDFLDYIYTHHDDIYDIVKMIAYNIDYELNIVSALLKILNDAILVKNIKLILYLKHTYPCLEISSPEHTDILHYAKTTGNNDTFEIIKTYFPNIYEKYQTENNTNEQINESYDDHSCIMYSTFL